MLGPSCGHLGAILGPIWGHLGILGPSWGHPGAMLGLSWRFRAPPGAIGALMELSWGILGPSWAILGPAWSPSGHLGVSPPQGGQKICSKIDLYITYLCYRVIRVNTSFCQYRALARNRPPGLAKSSFILAKPLCTSQCTPRARQQKPFKIQIRRVQIRSHGWTPQKPDHLPIGGRGVPKLACIA